MHSNTEYLRDAEALFGLYLITGTLYTFTYELSLVYFSVA